MCKRDYTLQRGQLNFRYAPHRQQDSDYF